MNREELVQKLLDTNKLALELRKEIDKFDLDESYKRSLSYVGNSYIDKDKNYIRCHHVYGIKENSELLVLFLSYYNDIDEHFSIEYNSYFRPWDINSPYKYEEISKQVFLEHYNNVQNLINNCLNKSANFFE